MKWTCPIAVLVSILAGCGQAAHRLSAHDQRPELSESLFKGDTEVLDNETIEQILSSKVVLPAEARIVVLNFGGQRWRRWWSEEVSQLDQAALDGFVEKVKACDRVGEAFVLPSMLAPERQTVPHLRMAAARCQADLIFLYRSTSEVYHKQRLLARDKARSYCLVEAVLLDTRTGIVRFTSTVVKSITSVKSKGDFNLTETVRKAELEALAEALVEVADELVAFLDAVPARQDEPGDEGR